MCMKGRVTISSRELLRKGQRTPGLHRHTTTTLGQKNAETDLLNQGGSGGRDEKTLKKEILSGLSLCITLFLTVPNAFLMNLVISKAVHNWERRRKPALHEVLKTFTLFHEDQETC